MFKRFQNVINTVRVIVDIAIMIGAFFLAYYLRFHTDVFGEIGIISYTFYEYSIILYLIIPINIIGYRVCGFYDSLRTKKFALQIRNTFAVNLLSMSCVFIYLYISENTHYSRLMIAGFFVISYLTSIVVNFIVKKALSKMRVLDKNLKHVVVVGAGRLGKEYSSKINTHKEYGYKITAFFDDNKEVIGEFINDTIVVGDIKLINEYLDENIIDLLVIAIPTINENKITQIINLAELHGVKSQIIPDYYHIMPAKPAFDEIDGLPLLHTRFVPLDKWINKVLKRIVDIIVSFIGLLVLSPFLLVVSVVVKITSPGPVVYKQKRVGYNRKEFDMYKFRSMKYQKDDKPGWTTENDSRTTKFGEFMRSNNIDELLQLINVLKGDMTLVGPRPEQPAFVKQFMYEIPKYMIKHHVKPGMTGWAQVNGWRGDTSIEERIKCDIYYIENWTLLFDFKIMLMTVHSGKKNAY